jgi:hypothetical protein
MAPARSTSTMLYSVFGLLAATCCARKSAASTVPSAYVVRPTCAAAEGSAHRHCCAHAAVLRCWHSRVAPRALDSLPIAQINAYTPWRAAAAVHALCLHGTGAGLTHHIVLELEGDAAVARYELVGVEGVAVQRRGRHLHHVHLRHTQMTPKAS